MVGNIEKIRKYASTVISQMRLGGFQDWLSVFLVFLSLLVATLPLEQAHWVSSSLSLVLTLVLAILTTSLMIVLHLRNKIIIISAIVLGLLVMVWKSSAIVPHADGQSALNAWWHSVSSTLPSQNSVYFAMFLIIVTWLIGCFSTWFVLKKKNAWITVLLGAVLLLFNISNLPNNYYYFLPLYIFFALLLIFQVNFAKKSEITKNRRDVNLFHNIVYLVLAVSLVVVLVMSAAWVSPQPPLAQIGVKFNTSSMHNVDPYKEPLNIFSPISDKWSWVESNDQTRLLFTAGLDESETILYLVTSDKPVYLLTRRYDTYNSWGWTSNPTVNESISAGTSIIGNTTNTPSDSLSYSVENRAKSDVILTTGQFVSADIPVILKTMPLSQTDPGQGSDIIAVTSPWVLGPYQHYNVVNNIPSFTTEQLSAVKSDFPDWITRQYLQLPDDFPINVKNLSLYLVKNAATQYDKLVAIKKYLNTLHYDPKGTVPSGTQDVTELFLTSSKKGNCVNFASAMVTMLRSVGVPARFCTGYLQGDYDKKTGKYIVRSKHAHAWAEVYFPGYGWIQFETTPDTGANTSSDSVSDNATFNYTDELPSWMQPDLTSDDSGLVPTIPYTPVHHNSGIWIFFIVIGGLFLIGITTRKVFDIRVGKLVRINNPSEAYGRMCFLAAFSQAGPMAQETPLEYSKRLETVISNHSDYIDDITDSYVSVRYSPRKEIMEEDKKINLQKSWKVVCHTLIQRRLQSGKWFLVRMLLNPE